MKKLFVVLGICLLLMGGQSCAPNRELMGRRIYFRLFAVQPLIRSSGNLYKLTWQSFDGTLIVEEYTDDDTYLPQVGVSIVALIVK